MFSVSSAGHCPLLSRRSIVTLVSALLVIPAWVVPCVAGDRGSDKIAVKLVLDYSSGPRRNRGLKSAALVKSGIPRWPKCSPAKASARPAKSNWCSSLAVECAGTTGDTIHVSADWIKKHPDDFGLVIHEMTHVIQHYPNPDPAGSPRESPITFAGSTLSRKVAARVPIRSGPNTRTAIKPRPLFSPGS